MKALSALLFLALMVEFVCASSSKPTPYALWSGRSDAFGVHSDGGILLTETHTSLETWFRSTALSTDLIVLMKWSGGVGSLRKSLDLAESFAYAPFCVADGSSLKNALLRKTLSVNSLDEAASLLSSKCKLECGYVLILENLMSEESEDQLTIFSKYLRVLTGGNYTFAVEIQIGNPPAAYEDAMNFARRRLEAPIPSYPTKFVRMTPDLLAGILTSTLVVIVILIGLTCLAAIATPDQFSDKPPPSSKEY